MVLGSELGKTNQNKSTPIFRNSKNTLTITVSPRVHSRSCVRVQLFGSESALRGIEQLKFLHIAVRKLKRRIYRHGS